MTFFVIFDVERSSPRNLVVSNFGSASQPDLDLMDLRKVGDDWSLRLPASGEFPTLSLSN